MFGFGVTPPTPSSLLRHSRSSAGDRNSLNSARSGRRGFGGSARSASAATLSALTPGGGGYGMGGYGSSGRAATAAGRSRGAREARGARGAPEDAAVRSSYSVKYFGIAAGEVGVLSRRRQIPQLSRAERGEVPHTPLFHMETPYHEQSRVDIAAVAAELCGGTLPTPTGGRRSLCRPASSPTLYHARPHHARRAHSSTRDEGGARGEDSGNEGGKETGMAPGGGNRMDAAAAEEGAAAADAEAASVGEGQAGQPEPETKEAGATNVGSGKGGTNTIYIGVPTAHVGDSPYLQPQSPPTNPGDLWVEGGGAGGGEGASAGGVDGGAAEGSNGHHLGGQHQHQHARGGLGPLLEGVGVSGNSNGYGYDYGNGGGGGGGGAGNGNYNGILYGEDNQGDEKERNGLPVPEKYDVWQVSMIRPRPALSSRGGSRGSPARHAMADRRLYPVDRFNRRGCNAHRGSIALFGGSD